MSGDPSALAPAFLAGLGEAAAEDVAGTRQGALESTLREALDACRRAWPRVSVEAGAWAQHLGGRMHAAGCASLESALATLPGVAHPDLYLAFAASRGDPAALGAIEALLPRTRQAMLRARSDVELDEAMQQLRGRLLLPRGTSPARLADYGGQGPLLHWLRMTAARVALNSARGVAAQAQAPAREDPELESLVDPGRAVDLSLIRAEHRAVFQRAFRQALAALEPRDRTLLRMWTVDGRSLEAIGAVYGTHKSTVSRWLAAARTQLRQGTLTAMQQALQVSTPEVESVLRELSSHLDSLSVLREPSTDEASPPKPDSK